MVKPKSQQSGKSAPDVAAIEKLTAQLADKPYGSDSITPPDESLAKITVTIPVSMRDKLDEMALKNKRAKEGDRNVSAIVRRALEQFLA